MVFWRLLYDDCHQNSTLWQQRDWLISSSTILFPSTHREAVLWTFHCKTTLLMSMIGERKVSEFQTCISLLSLHNHNNIICVFSFSNFPVAVVHTYIYMFNNCKQFLRPRRDSCHVSSLPFSPYMIFFLLSMFLWMPVSQTSAPNWLIMSIRKEIFASNLWLSISQKLRAIFF